MPPGIYVLVTLPPGMVAKGFVLSKGFQPKGLLKGTEVAPLVGAEAGGLGADTMGVDTKGFGIPLAVVVTNFLALRI